MLDIQVLSELVHNSDFLYDWELLQFSKEDQKYIKVINAGLYSREDNLHFMVSGTVRSVISENTEEIICTQALDKHNEYNEVSVIKMDIEGSELEALHGCEKLIYKNKPRLAICIYHKNKI